VTWDVEVTDTDSIHDNVTNNTRLTVPSGKTQARVSFGVSSGSATGAQLARTTKNGANYYGAICDQSNTAGGDSIHAVGPWVDVVPGDYFELLFTSGASFSLGASVAVWFAMECR
jgi:hypothetical protein